MKKFSLFLSICIALSLLVGTYAAAENDVKKREFNLTTVSSISSISDPEDYTTRHGYKGLWDEAKGAEKQQLYNSIMDAAKALWNSSDNLTEVCDTSGKYVYATIDVSGLNLTDNEVAAVYVTVQNDNPLLYFMSNSLTYSGGEIRLLTDYNKASDRNSCKANIVKGLNDFAKAVNGKTSQCDIIMTIYDKVKGGLTYAYEADGRTPSTAMWAHNVMGYFDSSIAKGVCESYARVLQLALNHMGIENYFVSGGAKSQAHAWNMAKFDDGKYYYMDATWDDELGGYSYFAKGVSFHEDHNKHTIGCPGSTYLYKIPDASATDYPLSGPSTIKTAEDFLKITLNHSGTYTLGANIDLTKVATAGDGIAYLGIDFKGTLNGKGYTISGVKAGLFKSISSEAKVDNVKINADFSGSAWVGDKTGMPNLRSAITETNNGTISNCTVDYKISNYTGSNLSTVGIGGYCITNYGTISDSSVSINVCDFSSSGVRGLSAVGIAVHNLGTVKGCDAKINVKNNSTDVEVDGIVMINGHITDENQIGIIENCSASGQVTLKTGKAMVANGIVGIIYLNSSVTDCTNSTDIKGCTGGSFAMGGIAGFNHGTIDNCSNSGDVYNEYNSNMDGMDANIGGICGKNEYKGIVKNCTNSGNIHVEYGVGGGIMGENSNETKIIDCINSGKISGTYVKENSGLVAIGGIAGEIGLSGGFFDGDVHVATGGNSSIENCTNKGKVVSEHLNVSSGCIVGKIGCKGECSVRIINCKNTGSSHYANVEINTLFGTYYNHNTFTEKLDDLVYIENSKTGMILEDCVRATNYGNPIVDPGGNSSGGNVDSNPGGNGGSSSGGNVDSNPGGSSSGGNIDSNPGGSSSGGNIDSNPGGNGDGNSGTTTDNNQGSNADDATNGNTDDTTGGNNNGTTEGNDSTTGDSSNNGGGNTGDKETESKPVLSSKGDGGSFNVIPILVIMFAAVAAVAGISTVVILITMKKKK